MRRLVTLAALLLVTTRLNADVLVPAKTEEQSPREELRKKVFEDSLSRASCKIISKNPAGTVAVDPVLTSTLQRLVAAINANSPEQLLPFFHPQLKVKLPQVAAALTSINRISGPGAQASLFRAYGLNSPDGEARDVACEDDGVVVRSLYGHRLQVAVWVQVQGRDEVSRVFANFVPTKNKWLVGAWNVQQWTHAGKDFVEWRAQAADLVVKKQPFAAWIYYDLAIKLLEGGKFLNFPVAKEILMEQAPLLGGKSPADAVAIYLPGEKVVYASSLFSRKGASILIRFGLQNEWSANAIREHCRAKYRQLAEASWMANISGIRCDYVLPKESPLKEGVMGGIFIDQETLKAK